jgi:cardiolipin synthase
MLATVAAGAGALLAVFRATQPNTPQLRIQPDIEMLSASSPTFPRMLELQTGLRLEGGNRVQVLLNGAGTYPRLWDDLRYARRSITLQSYYSKPGAMADTLSRILRAKARSGVRVLVLLDAFGSQAMPKKWLNELRRSGARVAMLRPLRWETLHGAADRSHVRAIVIDDDIGYTGGLGFADYWGGDGHQKDQWRETNVRVEGPAALQLQAAFAAGWLEATGELLTSRTFFDRDAGKDEPGAVRAGLLFTTTTTGATEAERFVTLALLSPRKNLYITNSYFVPNEDLRQLLADVVRRGVDVRVLTAGAVTDVATTRYAGRHHYDELLRAGVRIYEYRASMMHAKTISADGVWSAIGSMNFDSRSLAFNDESTLFVHDSAFAGRMDAVFFDDLAHADEITLASFRQRSRWQRTLEFGANLLAALL